MAEQTLTLIDVLGIQAFVYASNRLKDVAAGSEMVLAATDVRAFLDQRPELRSSAEVIYAAGGNALLRFDSSDAARDFTARYSRWLVDELPGLEVEVVHRPVRSGDWLEELAAGRQELELAKLDHAGHAPLLGLGVTAECRETRAVATHRVVSSTAGEAPVSRMVERRRRGQSERGTTWEERLGLEPWCGYELRFPTQNDDLGRSAGETSLIGVVHVDGNGVGAEIESWLAKQAGKADADVRAAQRQLSDEIDTAVSRALTAVLDRVIDNLRLADAEGRRKITIHSNACDLGFPLVERYDRGQKILYLPIRPLVLGGDDLTFLCDGRLALDLARTALERFRAREVESLGKALGACAGVAIVRSHAPFFRAQELAGDLCRHAKRELRKRPELGSYAIDWHIAGAGLLETVEELREREYTRDGSLLTRRPYPLGEPDRPSTFSWLDERLLGPTGEVAASAGFLDLFWQQRRNKIKALEELIGGGAEPDALRGAILTWSRTAGIDTLPGGLVADGDVTDPVPLLDAIELVDLHLPLRGET